MNIYEYMYSCNCPSPLPNHLRFCVINISSIIYLYTHAFNLPPPFFAHTPDSHILYIYSNPPIMFLI